MKLTTINQKIVNAIYSIPLGGSNWQAIVELLKKEFKANMGYMNVLRPNQTPIMISANSKNNEQWQLYTDACYESYQERCLLAKDEILIDVFDLEYIQIDTDYWKLNDHYHTGGGLLTTRNNTSIVIGFPRVKDDGVYEYHEIQQMRFYGGQIIRAIELEGVLGNSLPKIIYENALEASYGLTNAESRLVLELYKCGSLPKASKSLNRSYHTVRNHMKSIFKKTETSNQVELFKLLTTNYYK